MMVRRKVWEEAWVASAVGDVYFNSSGGPREPHTSPASKKMLRENTDFKIGSLSHGN
jgi:hypothetical protein